MKYHKQRILHDPENGQWGDCFRTVIACLLDLEVEDVPHFYDQDATVDEADPLLDEFLQPYGLSMFRFGMYSSPEHIMKCMAVQNPGMVYLISGKSPRSDAAHIVIAKDDQIIHDPHPDNTGLDGPTKEDATWIEMFVPRSAHLIDSEREAA